MPLGLSSVFRGSLFSFLRDEENPISLLLGVFQALVPGSRIELKSEFSKWGTIELMCDSLNHDLQANFCNKPGVDLGVDQKTHGPPT